MSVVYYFGGDIRKEQGAEKEWKLITLEINVINGN